MIVIQESKLKKKNPNFIDDSIKSTIQYKCGENGKNSSANHQQSPKKKSKNCVDRDGLCLRPKNCGPHERKTILCFDSFFLCHRLRHHHQIETETTTTIIIEIFEKKSRTYDRCYVSSVALIKVAVVNAYSIE